MLQLDDVTVRYGGLTALDGVSLTLREGAFMALVGANGAGKTTLFKAISGTVALTRGRILHRGCDIAAVEAFERSRRGIAHVPEGRHVFKTLSVAENLAVGAYAGKRAGAVPYEMIYSLFPRLAERRRQMAGMLSGGEQQMVAIARALAGQPSLLLLDEPSMGLAPAIVEEIFICVGKLHKEAGLTVLLVEQRVVEALELCDVAQVLQNGRIVATGTAAELMGDARVRSAYLGAH
ncbi:MAG: ABC transporter ATP-binding protein [Burkholderiaceae bacterium]